MRPKALHWDETPRSLAGLPTSSLLPPLKVGCKVKNCDELSDCPERHIKRSSLCRHQENHVRVTRPDVWLPPVRRTCSKVEKDSWCYWHWHHHLLLQAQEYGLAHVVGPAYPIPPHCPHCATVLPLVSSTGGEVPSPPTPC